MVLYLLSARGMAAAADRQEESLKEIVGQCSLRNNSPVQRKWQIKGWKKETNKSEERNERRQKNKNKARRRAGRKLDINK